MPASSPASEPYGANAKAATDAHGVKVKGSTPPPITPPHEERSFRKRDQLPLIGPLFIRSHPVSKSSQFLKRERLLIPKSACRGTWAIYDTGDSKPAVAWSTMNESLRQAFVAQYLQKVRICERRGKYYKWAGSGLAPWASEPAPLLGLCKASLEHRPPGAASPVQGRSKCGFVYTNAEPVQYTSKPRLTAHLVRYLQERLPPLLAYRVTRTVKATLKDKGQFRSTLGMRYREMVILRLDGQGQTGHSASILPHTGNPHPRAWVTFGKEMLGHANGRQRESIFGGWGFKICATFERGSHMDESLEAKNNRSKGGEIAL
ncbi:hypothetical protein FA13DRAFT_1890602 [Coprinellus micaceus]|uniref:Uncharacterized protein n=1 Tax=Coprinellus micaceus TaxID=71717 RepID=A0A4Y7RNY6_COPMI|nr:hypothetical protein FA13DRAFT_1890602 [Coprinellus micaceus]